MSYDLSFLVRAQDIVPGHDQFREYFMGRPHYTVREKQAWYENEDTGVYFSFDLFDLSNPDPTIEDEEDELSFDDGLAETGLSFNLNYFRPHIFGLEAEIELTALVRRFSLLVGDPQNEGMGRGMYSPEGFLRGWNAGNLFAHSASLNYPTEKGPLYPPGTINQLPTREIERLWRWNHYRKDYQARVGEEIYISLARLIKVNGQPCSFIVWGDALAQAIPPVDYLLLVRDELAPKPLFRKKTKDVCRVPFQALSGLLEIAEVQTEPVRHYVFRHSRPSRALMEFFRAQKPFEEKLDGLAWDSVLTSEIVEKAGKKGSGPAG